MADYQGISRSTLCRAVKEVVSFLCHISHEYITWPMTRHSMHAKALGFYRKFGKPCTVGCIDGTLIAIQKPSPEIEFSYICRKMFHSMNVMVSKRLIFLYIYTFIVPINGFFVYITKFLIYIVSSVHQAVCDVNCRIMAVDARMPGGNHDAFVLSSSRLHTHAAEGGLDGYWLLGDSGYVLVIFSDYLYMAFIQLLTVVKPY